MTRSAAVACAVVATLLCVLPPTSSILRNLYSEWNPIASMFEMQSLLSGAHHSLLVTKACEIGVFDAVGNHEARNSLTAEVAVRAASAVWTLFDAIAPNGSATRMIADVAASLDTECVGVRAVAEHIAQQHAVTVSEVDEGKLSALLEALSTLNLLRSCRAARPSARQGDRGFALRRHTRVYLVSPQAGGAVEDYLCGMGRIANGHFVINGLLNFETAIFKRNAKRAEGVEKGFLMGAAAHQDDLKVLWKEFSDHSGDFVTVTASRVAALLTSKLQTLSRGDSVMIRVVDVGCGSGVAVQLLSESLTDAAAKGSLKLADEPILVQFDIPAVIEKLLLRPLAVDHSRFRFVGGSAFSQDSVTKVAELLVGSPQDAAANAPVIPIALMSSFLQHFSDGDCILMIRQFAAELRRISRGSPVFVVITELDVPREQFNPLLELTTMGRVFSAVLASFTEQGTVREASEYAALGRQAGASNVEQFALFPMPATVTILSFS